MPRDDDDDLLPNATASGIHGVVALAAILGSSGAEYVTDLATAIRQIFGRGGLEAALREEKERAKASVLALAAIADGTLTEAERPAIAAFAKEHGLDPDDAIAKLMTLVEELRDPAMLQARVARAAADLSPDERLELYVAVKNLAHRGSRAWPPPGAAYRDAGPTPEALVAAFREALGIRIQE